ncbi:NINE protein [Gilliamella sp. Pra-s65]|uniref:NINE protein n=1 Tax=unclassified Gilliamella TaxID=2685620 RepID=UPI00136644D4|nr:MULTISPECIES: NINE protein [unclassified Gilliamella]MWN90301.1 NINE protein [Gilliamella sp. Pra-s65]MWP46430.1 NINE protein [Gilliamella sp. Pas-s27]MWP73242.1 NINE protein [Gilliamella sp. Pra-s52]
MRNKSVAYLLWFFLGFWGVHRMYCGKWITGIIWFFTAGLFGFGWFLDLFLTSGMVDYVNCIHINKYGQPPNNISIQVNNVCHSEPSNRAINEKDR